MGWETLKAAHPLCFFAPIHTPALQSTISDPCLAPESPQRPSTPPISLSFKRWSKMDFYLAIIETCIAACEVGSQSCSSNTDWARTNIWNISIIGSIWWIHFGFYALENIEIRFFKTKNIRRAVQNSALLRSVTSWLQMLPLEGL